MKNKVIGGEFCIDPNIEAKLNKDKKILFSSGRDALFEIMMDIRDNSPTNQVMRIQIPDFLCSSITSTICDTSFEYRFYHINEATLLPDLEDITNKVDDYPVILLINYFGVVNTDKEVDALKKDNDRIVLILDNVQDYYEHGKNPFVDYSFTSYRKWFAVPDGADVISKYKIVTHNQQINTFAQYKFAGNILKNYSSYIEDDISLELIKMGENLLDQNYMCPCSEISKWLFNRIDFENIEIIRKRNAKYLHVHLKKMNIMHLYNEENVPLFIPIFVRNRDSLRKKCLQMVFLRQYIGHI